MLIARNVRRLRARKRARCKVKVLAKLDTMILRRLAASPATR